MSVTAQMRPARSGWQGSLSLIGVLPITDRPSRGRRSPFVLSEGLSGLRSDMEAGFTAVDAKFDQVQADIREIKKRLAS